MDDLILNQINQDSADFAPFWGHHYLLPLSGIDSRRLGRRAFARIQHAALRTADPLKYKRSASGTPEASKGRAQSAPYNCPHLSARFLRSFHSTSTVSPINLSGFLLLAIHFPIRDYTRAGSLPCHACLVLLSSCFPHSPRLEYPLRLPRHGPW